MAKMPGARPDKEFSMSATPKMRRASRRTVRFATIAAALGVAGCFTAAFTFSGSEAQASAPAEAQILAQR